jgi:hypothetical protein
MKTTQWSALLATAFLISGCATVKEVSLSSFDNTQAEKLLQPGKNQIKGSGLLRQVGGGVVSCAGLEVRLVPATTHAQERVTAIYGNALRGYSPGNTHLQVKFLNESVQYFQQVKRTTCNAQGFFSFQDVADGEFYIGTTITWQVNPYVIQGGSLIERIRVKGGETKEVVLTTK